MPLNAKATYTANGQLVADLIRGTSTVGLTVSSSHGYSDVPGLLKWLDKYPYGCIEQTTSRAMPLLVFNDLSDLAGLPRDQALRPRVQDAIDSVLDMQNYSGNFGMWAAGSDADPWISVFALDFLYQAKDKGYVVPNDALKRGSSWLRTAASTDSNSDNTRAYAFYLLARTGQVNLSDLRYFADTRGPEMNTAIGEALTAAAAGQAGDRARAAYGFGRAREIALAGTEFTYPTGDYGSLLRDLAGTTALAAENGQADLIPALLKKSAETDMTLNATTTQEKAWMLRAAYELTRQKVPLNILVNGQPGSPRDGAIRLSPSTAQLNAGITFLNRGDAQVWRTTSVQGTPALPLPADAHGLTLTKTYLDHGRHAGRSGEPAPERPHHRRAVGPDGAQHLSPDGPDRSAARGAGDRDAAAARTASPTLPQRAGGHDDDRCARRPLRGVVHHRLALCQRRGQEEAGAAADLPHRLCGARRDDGHLRPAGRRGRGHVRADHPRSHDDGHGDGGAVAAFSP